MIDILIAADHPIFRLGLREFLNKKLCYNIVGEAGTGEEAIEMARGLNPRVVIIDTGLPGTNSIDATNRITKENKTIKVIALSYFDKDDDVMNMLKAGSKALVVKSGDTEEIITAIDKVVNDEEFYSVKVAEIIIKHITKGNPGVKALLKTPGFSDRELDIIKKVCQQKTAKEIGQLLFISEKTVDFHRQKIIEKMNVKNIVGLVIYAIKNGIVNVNEVGLSPN